MKYLQESFEFHKFDIDVRLVNEGDAQFIVDLRTNPSLSKFIHETSTDVSAQVEWIRNYKQREKAKEEYYFFFSKNQIPAGVIRITDIHPEYASMGSWLCSPNNDPETSVATLLIARDILFEVLDIEKDVFNVDRGNKHVARLHKQMGARVVAENERGYQYELTKNDYIKNRNNIYSILNLK